MDSHRPFICSLYQLQVVSAASSICFTSFAATRCDATSCATSSSDPGPLCRNQLCRYQLHRYSCDATTFVCFWLRRHPLCQLPDVPLFAVTLSDVLLPRSITYCAATSCASRSCDANSCVRYLAVSLPSFMPKYTPDYFWVRKI
jgi:hypothetical protein